MSNPEIFVEHDLFETVNVSLHIDPKPYEALFNELSSADGEFPPSAVHFFPALSWVNRYTNIDEATFERVYANTANWGNYDPDDKLLSVACRPLVDESNETFLHEAKHWGQDVHGELQTCQKWIDRALGVAAIGFAGGIAGVATGISIKNPDIAAPSALSMVLFPFGAFWYKLIGCKNERQAYRFAKDPEVLKSYGRILSYRAIA